MAGNEYLLDGLSRGNDYRTASDAGSLTSTGSRTGTRLLGRGFLEQIVQHHATAAMGSIIRAH
jgi:hypothetical protein